MLVVGGFIVLLIIVTDGLRFAQLFTHGGVLGDQNIWWPNSILSPFVAKILFVFAWVTVICRKPWPIAAVLVVTAGVITFVDMRAATDGFPGSAGNPSYWDVLKSLYATFLQNPIEVAKAFITDKVFWLTIFGTVVANEISKRLK